jgi:hypothetical protein
MTTNEHQNWLLSTAFAGQMRFRKKKIVAMGLPNAKSYWKTARLCGQNPLKRAELWSKTAGFGRIRNRFDRVQARTGAEAAMCDHEARAVSDE